VRELGRVEEVHQRVQLGHVVLDRRARQHHAVIEAERAQLLRQPRLVVLQAVGLVDDLSNGIEVRTQTPTGG
jgi:hypothetical protein